MMNGALTTGSQIASDHGVNFASSIDTPVTPPSMKLLDSRNPFSPIAAEKMPRRISRILSPSRGTDLMRSPNLAELEGLLRAPAVRRSRIRHLEPAAGGGRKGHGVPLREAPL